MTLNKAMLLLVMPLLVTSCGNHNSTPTINAPVKTIDSLCTQDSVIRTHGKDADVMDIRTVRAINDHNDLWVKLCGEPK
ncbi:hypothetical protein GCM10009413_32800 [Tatumella punctata]